MYLLLDDIKELQLDHSSRCNLSCPQCARTQNNWSTTSPNRNLDLTIEDYNILLAPFPPNQIQLFHCGNFGDALASPTFDQTLDFSLSKNPKRIKITTNGSLRSPDWWKDLALKGRDVIRVAFSIDGLEDTNSIYRVNSSWKKILTNIKSFIENGGYARWDFIEFKHNYHQIKSAQKMASDLGFKEFNVKYTARFAEQEVQRFKTSKGHIVEDVNFNPNKKNLEDIKSDFSSFDSYASSTSISCKYKLRKSIFVDMKMRLWPCCWFGAPPYLQHKNKQQEDFQYLNSLYGEKFNCLRTHGWDVLTHDFFRNYLEQSWSLPTKKYRRFYTCGRTCGERFEFSSGYGKNKNHTSL